MGLRTIIQIRSIIHLICWNCTCTNVNLKPRLMKKLLGISTYNQHYLKKVFLANYCRSCTLLIFQPPKKQQSVHFLTPRPSFQLIKLLQFPCSVFNITSVFLDNGYKSRKSRSCITFTLQRGNCPTVYLIHVEIPQQTVFKYLGPHLDAKLTWKHHIKQ